MKSTTTFTHNDANEQTAMTVDGTTTNFAYDAWGRLTSRTRGSLTALMKYRYGDRLYEVTSNFPGEAAEVEYNYDGMGLRRAALVNGTDLTWWRWNGMSVYSEHEVSTSTPWDIESGDTIKTHFPGLGYAEPSGGYPMVTFKFYTTDHLGSVRGIWDGEWFSTVNNLATYDYTPYGDILQQSGLPLDVGFTGHHWDNHIQQYFAPFRFYSPTTLRWNMRDPLGFIDGPNVYAYVRGNVIHMVDITGLSMSNEEAKCEKLWKKLINLRRKIAEKTKDLEDDRLKLPQTHPNDCKQPRLSKRGHERLLAEHKENLNKRIQEYIDKCTDNGRPKYKVLPVPILVPGPGIVPVPGPHHSSLNRGVPCPSQNWIVVGGY